MKRSTLVTSNECKKCAKCCTSFTTWSSDDEGTFDRLSYLKDKAITITKTYIDEGPRALEIKLNSPCRNLACKDNSDYSCDIWDSSSLPELCRTYPSNLFLNHNGEVYKDKQLLEKILIHNQKNCPQLKKYTIDDIIKIKLLE